MEILLVESNSRRRVTVARHLSSHDHRVTLASSIDEAHELLDLAGSDGAAPRIVIVGEPLLRGVGQELREEVAVRFPGVALIPLRADLELDWLSGWLDKLAAREHRARPSRTVPLNIVLIEADKRLREAMRRHLALGGDRVSACKSLDEASTVLADLARRRVVPHVIAAPVKVAGRDFIGFHLTAKARFPQLRWIVTSCRPRRNARAAPRIS
jgi:hypothetical protein